MIRQLSHTMDKLIKITHKFQLPLLVMSLKMFQSLMFVLYSSDNFQTVMISANDLVNE